MWRGSHGTVADVLPAHNQDACSRLSRCKQTGVGPSFSELSGLFHALGLVFPTVSCQTELAASLLTYGELKKEINKGISLDQSVLWGLFSILYLYNTVYFSHNALEFI